jgi:hypothetical protein
MKIALTLFLALSVFPCCAQTGVDSWENLRQLREGDRIEVADARMKSYAGGFAGYTADSIVLRQAGSDVRIVRSEVASVRRLESRRRRNVLLGLAIGAAGGLAAGAIKGATYHEEGETPVFIMVYTPIGAGIGAVAGAVLPAGHEVTVYRAKSLPGR